MMKTISLCLGYACIFLFSTFSFAQTCPSSDLSAAGAGVAPSLCGNCDGSASVTATGGTPPYTYLWSTGETAPGIGASQVGTSLCLNAGGALFNASSGKTFLDDQYFSGGTTFSNALAIANTTDDVLFQTERFVGNGGFFSYNVPVANGTYLVELYFAEIFFGTSPTRPGGVGSRLFDVSIEGVLVLDDYDVFLDAGGPATAVIKSFNVNVTDGTLNILFDGVVNNAKINALCITPVSSTGLCAGEYFATVTDALGCTATAMVSLASGACDDGDGCTTDACANALCIYTPIICDDSDSCTADVCDNGICIYTPIAGCGDPCTNILCDDEDPCTTDACDAGNCVYTPLNCNDNDLCTIDSCFGTQCIYIPIACDDGDSCTIDFCDNGTCLSTAIPGCGDPCNTLVCFDNDACTADGCANGQCVFTPVSCSDNDPCTTDTCAAGCLNIAVNCDDSNSCTIDNCVNGSCEYTAIPGCSPCTNVVCNDNDVCTSDACNNGLCIFLPVDCDDNNPCTDDACAGGCQNTPADCDDNDPCTVDACVNGCENTPLPCDDGDACTTDACDNGLCVFTPIACDDSDLCTADTCLNGQCAHTPIAGCVDNCTSVNCNDNDVCTVDTCINGQCVYSSSCDDGDPCTTDYCRLLPSYFPFGNGYYCRYRDVHCDDRDDCTTDECVNGVCVFTPLVCDDNDACTQDECKRGRCKFKNINCSDYDACTIDACNTTTGCTNTPRDCDDNDPCTIDLCVSNNNDDDDDDDDDDRHSGYGWWGQGSRCTHLPIVCDDSDACTHDACDNAGNCANTVIPGCCTSDALCDDLDACTLDKCLSNVCRNTASTLVIEEVQGFCQNGRATLQPSETGDSYAWSTGETSFTIQGMPDSTYSVTITKASGCVKSASITVSAREELLSSFVLLADDEISLYRNTVHSGGVGVTDRRGEANLKNQTMITAAGTFVQADDINLSGGSQIATAIPTRATVALPSFKTNPYCNYGGSNVIVGAYQQVTLSGSVYGNVSIGAFAQVTFTSADVYMRNLNTRDNATIRFADCTEVKICKKMSLGDNNTLNPDSAEVIFYVEDEVEIESGVFVFATIYVRDGDIEVDGSSSGNPGRLTGLFIADEIDAKDNTHWYANAHCNSICAPAQHVVSMKMAQENNAAESAPGALDEGNARLHTYPNPFGDMLRIEFMLPQDARARLEVFNLAGQRLAVLFDGNVAAGAVQQVDYRPEHSEGMLIYRLQTPDGIYYGKAVKGE